MNLRTLIAIPFAAMMLAMPLVACQSTEQAAVPSFEGAQSALHTTRITKNEISALRDDERLVLSTSGVGEVLVFDPSQGALDFWRIELICPNGQRMGMDLWLNNLAKEQGVDVAKLTAAEFSLALTQEDALEVVDGKSDAKTPTLEPQRAAEEPSPCCAQTCYLCEDGAWICYCSQWCSGGDPIP